MKVHQYYDLVVSTLNEMQRQGFKNAASDEACDIIMMTAMHESAGLRYDTQMGGGPARGYLQMEVATHDDIYANYLDYRPHLKNIVLMFANGEPSADILVSNHAYAIAMARVHYYRVPEALPKKCDENYLDKLAKYCKMYYNITGKATWHKYLNDYRRYWLNADS